MHSVTVRLNTVIFFALTVLLVSAIMCAFSTYLHKGVPIVNSMKINKLQSLRHHGGVDRALLSFDLSVDLKPAFHWNSKQLFLYIVAEYASKSNPINQVVVWDKIVSPDQGSLRISNELVKYALIDNGANLRGNNVTFKFRWDHMPLTGRMYSGEDLSSHYTFKLPKDYIKK